ncbi:MAG: hypothetical protein JEY97_04595 [Bacteroidales bacterium]|nr:hypothetical protein [Bacteroidales bacterium]
MKTNSVNFDYLLISSALHDSNEFERSVSAYIQLFSNHNGLSLKQERIDTINPLFYFVVTGGTERKILELHAKRKKFVSNEAVFLIAYPENNSLPAALEVLARLIQSGENGRIFFLNSPDDEQGIQKIIDATLLSETQKSLQHSKIGMAGNASEWLVASNPEPEIIKKVWGPKIVPIEPEDIFYKSKKFSKKEVESILNSFLNKAEKIIEPSKEELFDSASIYMAIKEIIKNESLNAFTLRCFDLVINYKITGCLALAKLNDDGIIAGCESDIPSTLAMLWIKLLLNENSWMANPAEILIKENSLWLAHCTIAPCMVDKFIIRSHFETGLGVGIQGEMESQNITLVRIGGERLDKLWLAEGRITRPGFSEFRCRTQVKIKLSDNYNVEDLLNAPLGNHIVLIKGHHAAHLSKWHEMMINIQR